MTTICKNCNTKFEGKYCNECGQSAETARIDFKSIKKDLLSNFLHYNDNIFFTTKELVTRPGHTIREYIQGKRIKHLSPITYVLLIASIYSLLNSTLHIHVLEQGVTSHTALQNFGDENLNNWITSHFSWIAIFSIPLFALGTYLAFPKQGYNFVEHLIINSFIVSQRFILDIMLFPLTYYVNDTHNASYVRSFVMLCEFIFRFWSIDQLFPNVSKFKIFLLLIVSYIILFALVAFIILTTNEIFS